MRKKKFYGLKNDYVFHAVLQESQKALKALVSAFMDIPENEIMECIVENPLIYGKHVQSKRNELDVRILLNGNQKINMELQIKRIRGWADRTILYLCRMFDELNSGEEYTMLIPVIHIGILNYALDPNEPQFLSEYTFVNTTNGKVYSDKIRIRIIDLTHTELAGASIQEWKLTHWAKAFNADSIEEMEALGEEEEVFREVAEVIRRINEDPKEVYERRLREVDEWWEAVAPKYAEFEAKEEGRAEGRAEGIEEGKAAGIELGELRFAKLVTALAADNRFDDIKKASEDPAFRERLYREKHISTAE